MADNMAKDSIDLPLDLIKKTPGFTFDIGASVAKIIYRSKSEYRNGSPISGDTTSQNGMGKMSMMKLPCDDIDGVIALLRSDCDVTRNNGTPEVIVTGVGANRNKEKFEKALDVRLKVVSEFDTLVDGMLLLLKTYKDPFLPLAAEPKKVAVERFLRFQNFLKSYKDQSRAKWVKQQDVDEALSWKPDPKKIFPYITVSCGSIVVFHKVYENGSYENLDVSEIGGICVLALLAQLTKEKNFDNLLSMAATSDGRSVDLYASDMRKQENADDPYTSFDSDSLIFPFGKAYHATEIKSGDVAFSILNIVSANLCQVAHQMATIHSCPHVVFTGNFVSSSVVQDWLTRDMMLRNLRVPKERRVQFNFLRHGGMLVGLGALAAGANFLET